jgi:uncharacterized protein
MKKGKTLIAFCLLILSLTVLACGGTSATNTPAPGQLVRSTAAIPSFAPTPAPNVTPSGGAVVSAPNAPLAPTPLPTSSSTLPAIATPPTNAGKEVKCVANLPCQPRLLTVNGAIKNAEGKEVTLSIELARTATEQQMGLMGRSEMGANEGMLFIFQNPTNVGFYMKNTALPLSIAFIDGDGKIVDIKDMQPYDEKTVNPSKVYLLALEVNQGFFTRNGIKIGDSFNLK